MLEYSNLLFKLRALRHRLNLATYAALFAADPTARTTAAQEATALNQAIEEELGKSWDAASQITSFVRSPAQPNRLTTLNEYVQLLEDLAASPERSHAMSTMPFDGQYGAEPAASPASTN